MDVPDRVPERARDGAPQAGPKEIPQDRVYFRIGEVATLLGVEPHVVRFWQQQFPAVRPERSQAGRFLYPRAAVERLVRIRTLLYDEGYTIAGAKKALQSPAVVRPVAPPPPAAKAPVPTGPSRRETELAAEIERLQRELRALQARVEAAQQGETYARQREAGAVQREEVAAARQRAGLQAALGEVTAMLERLH